MNVCEKIALIIVCGIQAIGYREIVQLRRPKNMNINRIGMIILLGRVWLCYMLFIKVYYKDMQ